MDITFPVETADGYKYLIELTEQSLDFANIIIENDIKIYNITLSCIEVGESSINPTFVQIGKYSF